VPLNLTIGTLSPTRQTIKDSMDMVNLLWPKVENLVVIVVGVQVIGWGQMILLIYTFSRDIKEIVQEDMLCWSRCIDKHVILNILSLW
jgi:hypothetical protein